MRKLYAEASLALSGLLKDGMTIMSGGFGLCGIPETLIEAIRDSGAKALELLDRASLRSVETQPGVPASIRTVPDGTAALLVEYQAAEESARKGLEAIAATTVAPFILLEPARFTHDAGKESRTRCIIDRGEFYHSPIAVQITLHACKSIKR